MGPSHAQGLGMAPVSWHAFHLSSQPRPCCPPQLYALFRILLLTSTCKVTLLAEPAWHSLLAVTLTLHYPWSCLGERGIYSPKSSHGKNQVFAAITANLVNSFSLSCSFLPRKAHTQAGNPLSEMPVTISTSNWVLFQTLILPVEHSSSDHLDIFEHCGDTPKILDFKTFQILEHFRPGMLTLY